MEWKEMITADPKVMVGKPVIRGTRLTAEFIIELPGERLDRRAGDGALRDHA